MGDVLDLKGVGQTGSKRGQQHRVKADGPTRITTERAVFCWLFERLDECEPRISVDATIVKAKNSFLEAVSSGKCLRRPLHWQDLLPGIKWDTS